MEAMHAGNDYGGLRSTRDGRLIARGPIRASAMRRVPVLPAGWAPLTREQQEAVLNACDAAQECLMFRLGSLWDPRREYRVYKLTGEQWVGLCVVARYATSVRDACAPVGADRQLLGLGCDVRQAIRLAIEFFNGDVEAHGEQWRLNLEIPNR